MKTIRFGARLSERIVLLAVLLSLELLSVSLQFDSATLRAQFGLAGFIGVWASHVSRILVASAALFTAFGFTIGRSQFDRVSIALSKQRISWSALAAHFCSFLIFCLLSYILFRRVPGTWPANVIASGWIAMAVVTFVMALVAFVPPRIALELARTNQLWLPSLLGGGIAVAVGGLAQSGWAPLARLTFALASVLLRPLMPDLIVNPATMLIEGDHFYVFIYPECSGFEGAGLMLIFSALALWFFRRDCRFPQALLVLPLSVFVMWVLNVVRIAALVLIGDKISADVAISGFHSQAGWIVFSAVALALTILLRHIPWLTKSAAPKIPANAAANNPNAWYLMPFLLSLAVVMVARAAAGSLEWMSAVRLIAVGGVLWYYRKNYLKLDWRFSWVGLGAGLAAFALLRALHTSALNLDLFLPASRFKPGWLAVDILAAAVLLPVAEELAFRGFLLRRLVSSDFQAVPSHRFTFIAVVISSLAYGVLQGAGWLPAAGAGLVYALAFRYKGKIGDALAAHITTNALLCCSVIVAGNRVVSGLATRL